jgi:hypothetical protein
MEGLHLCLQTRDAPFNASCREFVCKISTQCGNHLLRTKVHRHDTVGALYGRIGLSDGEDRPLHIGVRRLADQQPFRLEL